MHSFRNESANGEMSGKDEKISSLSLDQQNEIKLKFAFRREQLSTINIWYSIYVEYF
jgi:hypothetical protein